MNNLSPDLRQGLYSLGILFLVILAFYTVLIQPAISARSKNTERIEDLMFQSSKFTLSSQESDSLKEKIANLKNQNPNKNNFLQNKAPAIVAADLQKKIKALVESSGGNLVSTHALTDGKEELFSKITVKVYMRTDIKALRDVFYQIAINEPLLFTENILIQKSRARSRRKQRVDNQIEVRFDVSGYMNPSL
jgi:Type II secretion system (T2SS), protein M subtype b